jgi:hypothetical protein
MCVCARVHTHAYVGESGNIGKTLEVPSVRDIIRAPVGGIRGSGTYIP